MDRAKLKTERGKSSDKRQREDVEVELIGNEQDQRPDKVELLLYAKRPEMKERLGL